MKLPSFGHDARVNTLICCGHTLSHFYILMLPTMFLAWQQAFGVSFAELGISVAVMSGTTAVVQTPIGFLVDRFGARRFLIGGTLLMTLSISLMGVATSFWQIVALAMLSGLGNAVFHPADYAILSGSIHPSRLGRSFAIHTFVGHVGFASAPPVTAALIWLIGWRGTLLSVGLIGIPVTLAILWQSRILADQKRAPPASRSSAGTGARMLFSPSIMLFFGFFMASSMAGAGIQSWLITVLHSTHGLTVEAASSALTGFMVGTMSGVLVGGWVADRTDRHFLFVMVLTLVGSALILLVNLTDSAAGGDSGLAVPHRAPDRGQPHTAGRDGQGCRPAWADRQGVRVRQLGPCTRRRRDAGTLRDAYRCRPARAGADPRRRIVAGEPALRRERPG